LYDFLCAFEKRKLVEIQFFYKPQFFIRFNLKVIIQPERIDGAAYIAVAVAQTVNPDTHGIATDPPCHFLEIRNG
jgi:hypothetical protein